MIFFYAILNGTRLRRSLYKGLAGRLTTQFAAGGPSFALLTSLQLKTNSNERTADAVLLDLLSKENVFRLIKSYSSLWFNLNRPGGCNMTHEEVEEAERSLDQALFLFGVIRDVYDDLPEDIRKLVRDAPIPHLGSNLVSLSLAVFCY
jgi:hypothetical protein